MLTLDNMGLSRGGFRSDLYSRDSFGFGLDASSLEVAEDNVALQQQLNDFLHNSCTMQQGGVQNQCGGYDDLIGGSGSYAGLASLGFSQPDIDRGMLFDDLPPVVGHENLHDYEPVSNALFSSTSSVELGSSHVPGLPSASFQSQVTREQWDCGEGLTSRNGLKRGRSLDNEIDMQPWKKLDKTARSIRPKGNRVNEQADHILRERQRRDDMTSKFAILESLLPIGTKRDRSTIVDESIEYVKNLHHRIKELQDRKMLLKQSAVTTSNDNTAPPCRKELIKSVQPGSPSRLNEKQTAVPKPPISREELSRIHSLLRSCLENVEIHADLPNQVVIEMVCKPQPRLQSNILQCLECLSLDIMQCSITKIAHRLICVITAKSQEATAPTSGIVAALKSTLQGSD